MHAPQREWTWDDARSDWSVTLDEERRMLTWWGADKPQPGIPAFAQGGGCQTQTFEELLATERSPYACPRSVLVQVLDAVRSLMVCGAKD